MNQQFDETFTDIFGSAPPKGAATSALPKVGVFAHGIHDGIPNQVYHSLDMISNSYLSRLDKCPAAAKVRQETTPAMVFGSAAHCYILEGAEKFHELYAIAPVCDKRTKDGKAMFADFQIANAGKEVISVADVNQIIAMSKAVHAHPFAAKLLESGIAEQSIFWQDAASGLGMKCRPDWIPEVGEVLVDLKTCDSSDERGFLRSIVKYGYHRQAALYLDGAAAAGIAADTFAFIAVEKTEPFRVEIHTLCPDFINAGRDDYRRILDIEARCRAANSYPHFTNPGVNEIAKPAYL